MGLHFTTLYKCMKPHYTIGSPVIIEAEALLRCNETEDLLGQLKFKNVVSNTIQAISIELLLLDTANRPLGISIPFQYLDLCASRNVVFGNKIPIPISDLKTRSFIVRIAEVVFTDKTVWTSTETEWDIIQGPQLLCNMEYELEKQYRLQYGDDCICCFGEEKDLWYCSCGAINHNNEEYCHSCGREYTAQRPFNLQELEQECTNRLAQEKAIARQQEEARIAAEEAILHQREEKERAKEERKRAKQEVKRVKAEAKQAKKEARIAEKVARKQHREENRKANEATQSIDEATCESEKACSNNNEKETEQTVNTVEYEQAKEESVDATNIMFKDTNEHEDNSFVLQEPEKSIAEETAKGDDKKEKENRPTKVAKICIIVAICFVVLAAGAWLFVRFGMPMIQYKQAENHFANAEYAEAQALFEKLGDYKNSNEMLVEIGYIQTKTHIETNNYEEAEQWLRKHIDYKDAEQLLNTCMYSEAESELEKGNYLTSESFIIGNDLGETEEGKRILNSIHYLSAKSYKEKHDLISYNEELSKINIDNGFIDTIDQQEVEKEIAERKAKTVEPVSKYSTSNLYFWTDFSDSKETFDFKVTNINAKRNGDNIELTISYESSSGIRMHCFSPPEGEIFMYSIYGGAGKDKVSFSLSKQLLSQTSAITMRVCKDTEDFSGNSHRNFIVLNKEAVNMVRSLLS